MKERHMQHTDGIWREVFFFSSDLCSCLQGVSLTPHEVCEQCTVVRWIVGASLTNARRAAGGQRLILSHLAL